MDRLIEVEKRAKEQISRHCPEYRFAWMRKKRTLGQCNHSTKTISLSKTYVLNNPDEMVNDTILHEIAHALTPGQGHNARWKAMARKLGATPKRKSKSPEMDYKHYLECVKGCFSQGYFRRPSARTIAFGLCAKCGAPLEYKVA